MIERVSFTGPGTVGAKAIPIVHLLVGLPLTSRVLPVQLSGETTNALGLAPISEAVSF